MRNSLKVFLCAVVLGMGMSVSAHAAGATRGAKPDVNINYTTTVTTISVGPSVLYAIRLSTPTTFNDFVAFFDTATLKCDSTCIATSTATLTLKGRVVHSSTGTFNYLSFDPPIQFQNGIMALESAATNWSAWTYEKGRVTQGY